MLRNSIGMDIGKSRTRVKYFNDDIIMDNNVILVSYIDELNLLYNNVDDVVLEMNLYDGGLRSDRTRRWSFCK
ncbi:hypothetical protein SADUNF_Sadunf18G0065600 [Salix dunnii]|uniref:Uncharacterized protein n=1 Tax=Salix dunnii TaxID=1413687 RepID=A0A835J310_9ROSI|nr:hypothetical protein SADUNF_Sadunf18G0065600 [Salix dunnii]